MQTMILTFSVFALAMLGHGLGLFFRRAPLEGSCGGIACQKACHACPRKHQEERRT
jgi:hypothetical protein